MAWHRMVRLLLFFFFLDRYIIAICLTSQNLYRLINGNWLLGSYMARLLLVFLGSTKRDGEDQLAYDLSFLTCPGALASR